MNKGVIDENLTADDQFVCFKFNHKNVWMSRGNWHPLNEDIPTFYAGRKNERLYFITSIETTSTSTKTCQIPTAYIGVIVGAFALSVLDLRSNPVQSNQRLHNWHQLFSAKVLKEQEQISVGPRYQERVT